MKLVRESQSLPGLIAGLAKRHGDRCALGQAHNSGQASSYSGSLHELKLKWID